MPGDSLTVVALSGGVDSAVVALLLRDAGHTVQCLHMSNWEDDGYCDNAREFQDARRVCLDLGLPLHRVNFAREYREQVFADFLAEYRKGRTPNPDVLCNRQIKFGVMRRYAQRLGATRIATGHYARVATVDGVPQLRKGVDAGKDQSYFLHAVAAEDLVDVLMPLGDLQKSEVREIAREAGLAVAEKKDSTGICFIGERPFAEFLHQYLPDEPGVIRDELGQERGRHRGLAYYTLGQRHGLSIGGVADRPENAWYVAAKNAARNELVVVQGHEHPLLKSNSLVASRAALDRPAAGRVAAARAPALPSQDSLPPTGPSLHRRTASVPPRSKCSSTSRSARRRQGNSSCSTTATAAWAAPRSTLPRRPSPALRTAV